MGIGVRDASECCHNALSSQSLFSVREKKQEKWEHATDQTYALAFADPDCRIDINRDVPNG